MLRLAAAAAVLAWVCACACTCACVRKSSSCGNRGGGGARAAAVQRKRAALEFGRARRAAALNACDPPLCAARATREFFFPPLAGRWIWAIE
ncbi:hypothetical protein VFPFJ_09096 [Purpureocillium lilacinum]|uniref:Secreted protein n=1 Tax=Purpureocillium lilacinum TaxID=33203 RepID=A0A179H194_PURLI|nr:hypothetical protein VFPFJ_09096 [Purpureocillium lilacinum]OAQ83293.1 hypothetical protein VFPFJ_09096 [Purpureocillium lilacinum]